MASRPAPPAIAETHISWVILTEDRALKIAKPVVTDVLDQSTVELRRAACAREVELNSRLAPDVYLGVGELMLDEERIEPVVVMRRMPSDRRLSALLDGPDAEDLVRAVARQVSEFHARAEVLDGDTATSAASSAALRRRWEADLAGMLDVGGTSVSGRVDEARDRARSYIEGRAALLDERIRTGMVRDGHGDLLADDIFCLDDGPRILDCLAFSDELRHGDVLADVAFLVMDLQRLGHGELGRSFLRDYCEFSGEHHPASLSHLYVAQRCLVRAKVGALRAGGADADVDRLLDMTVDHLDRATVRLVLVGGLPGSGKSTVATGLGDEMGWAVVSSDEVRRDLGLRQADMDESSAYASETVARVYEEMRRRAEDLVAEGISVVLDATWSSEDERERAHAVATEHAAELVELRCDAPLDLCRARVATRTGPTESEATPAVVDLLQRTHDDWPSAITIDTSGDPFESTRRARRSVSRPSSRRPA
jgi:uncharacterized protein